MLVSTPVMYGGRFLGMIGSVVDLQFLYPALQEVNRGGLTPYVVDSQGRLVAAPLRITQPGRTWTNSEIVRNFVEQGSKAQMVAATREFTISGGKNGVKMLGTYSPVSNLDWAVVVQKPRSEAYRGVYEMQRNARLLALLAVLLSIGISIFAARKITNPLEVLDGIQPRDSLAGIFPNASILRAALRLASWPRRSTLCQRNLSTLCSTSNGPRVRIVTCLWRLSKCWPERLTKKIHKRVATLTGSQNIR